MEIVGIVVAALVLALVVYALLQPNTFRVERRALISAPPEKIFPLLNDFHAWQAWSPWEKLDPEMTRTYGGPQSGVGANYSWESQKAGAGRMEITEAIASSKLALNLDFTKPMKAHNKVDFVLRPEGAATSITWAMFGPQPFIGRMMCLFFNMDRVVGKDFDAGLANLKAAAEK